VVDDIEIQHLDELESNHFWYQARKLQLSKWFAQYTFEANVLDLGSATGGNTLHISSLGHQVTSVEYSDLGVLIQKKKGIPVIQADARRLPFSEATFDVVVCLDVLEHIVEDQLVASEIFRVLKPGGRFLIAVPEDPKLWSAHDVAVNHVRRYSKTALLSLIKESGLSYNDVWSTLVYLRPAILLARKFSKSSSLGKLNFLANQLLYLICKAELMLPRLRRKGVTLWIDGVK
jgi:SAM-dependent methyltransferase